MIYWSNFWSLDFNLNCWFNFWSVDLMIDVLIYFFRDIHFLNKTFFRLKFFLDQNFLTENFWTQKLLTKIQRLSKLNTLDLSLVEYLKILPRKSNSWWKADILCISFLSPSSSLSSNMSSSDSLLAKIHHFVPMSNQKLHSILQFQFLVTVRSFNSFFLLKINSSQTGPEGLFALSTLW